MKKVINGKVYDTSTAKKVGEYDPNPYKSDFNCYCEELYQKKTGEFFLYGEGNAASPYCRYVTHSERCGGEAIEPLSYKAAAKWAEEHLEGDEYIAIFGDPEENADKTVISISIRKDTYEKVKQAAAKEEVTISEFIEKATNSSL